MDKQNKIPTVNGVKWKLDNVNKYNKQFAENWDKPVEKFIEARERYNFNRNFPDLDVRKVVCINAECKS